MSVYMCIYIYIHVYIHSFVALFNYLGLSWNIYIYIRTYIHVYVQTSIHTDMHICMYVCMYACMMLRPAGSMFWSDCKVALALVEGGFRVLTSLVWGWQNVGLGVIIGWIYGTYAKPELRNGIKSYWVSCSTNQDFWKLLVYAGYAQRTWIFCLFLIWPYYPQY